jgi:hypothetical protein
VNIVTEIAKCRVQNAKVKMKGKDAMARDHPSIFQSFDRTSARLRRAQSRRSVEPLTMFSKVETFESYNLHFALAAAKGRAMHGGCDES